MDRRPEPRLEEPRLCRPGCGACCIAPSITRALPGMPHGKPAGVPCVQLDEQMRCRVFGRPERPDFCGGLQPSAEMCGTDRAHAITWLSQLEQATRPQTGGAGIS
ncbi:MAG: YkgJ family cysteine cluster protein [Betaproteobacteria bacterium]|nr:YkgJ family cysteine cluster protein [Betaproteobacteria bacterium]